MIVIEGKTYIVPSERDRVRAMEHRSCWPDKPAALKFKQMDPDEFLRNLLDKQNVIGYTYIYEDGYAGDGLNNDAFLPILFPAYFVSLGGYRVFVSDSGQVYAEYGEVTGWDCFENVIKSFSSWEDYKTAVLGPYKNN